MRAAGLVALAALAACKYDRPSDVGPDGVIIEDVDATVRVTGLWAGAAPITVILRGDGEPIETSLPGNGEVSVRAVSGIATTVEVQAPDLHTCTAPSPVTLAQDAVIAVTCVGPATLTLKTPYDVPVPFDASELEVSSLVGEADLVVTGSVLTRITVDGLERTIAAETRVPIVDITRSGRELGVRLEADTLSIEANVTIKPVLPISEVARIAVGGVGERGGQVVAVDKDLIVVGGNMRASGDRSRFAVRVYRLKDSTWTFEAELPGPVGGGAYGTVIAVSDDTIIVGAPTATNAGGTGAGEVWFWQWSSLAWGDVRVYFGGAAGAEFGATVAIDGNRAAAGAPQGAANNQGYVKTYTLADGDWGDKSTINPNNNPELGIQNGDRFGSGLAIRGNQMLVGAAGDDRAGQGWKSGAPGSMGQRDADADYGAVFQFSDDAVTSWLQLADSVATSSMGSAVAFAGEDWLVGVPLWDDNGAPDAGLAYVGPMANSILNADSVQNLANYGRIVAGTSSSFIIGARDRVRVYAREDGSSYPLLDTLEDPEQPSFATGAAMASGSIVVGVPDDPQTDTGSIVIYR